MLRVRIEALEQYRSFIRPIILSSVRHINHYYDADQDVRIWFNGEAEVTRMLGTTFTEKIRTDRITDVGYENRLFVTAEEETSEVNDALDSCHRWVANHPFWEDPETKARIFPMYVTKKYSVSINRYFKDRVTAYQFRDRLRNSMANPQANAFSTIIHYPVSHQMLACFEDIHTRLVNVGKVSADVDAFTWFQQNALIPTDIITNLIGNNACFVFKQSIEELSLLFDGVEITQINRGRYQGQYLATYRYSFFMPVHTQYELHYPIMVYQQLTHDDFIPHYRTDSVHPNDYPTYRFYEAQLAGEMELNRLQHRMNYMLVFPVEDTFRPPVIPWLNQQLQRLTSLDDITPQITLNLFTFSTEPDGVWDETFVKYITQFHDKLNTRYRNPMYLAIWSDDIRVVDEHVQLDENGDVSLLHAPTMSASYRIAFYLDRAIWQWSGECVDDILSDETYGRWILNIIAPGLPLPGDKQYCGPRYPGSLPWLDWEEDVLGKINWGKEGELGDETKIYMMDALLIANNEDDYRRQAVWKDTAWLRCYYARK